MSINLLLQFCKRKRHDTDILMNTSGAAGEGNKKLDDRDGWILKIKK